jgi:hypothetical protein
MGFKISNGKQLAAVDKMRTMILPLRNPSPVGRERVPKAGEEMRWQRLADFETLRQVTEKGGPFPGQHPSFAVGCYGGWTPASQCLMLVRMKSRPR